MAMPKFICTKCGHEMQIYLQAHHQHVIPSTCLKCKAKGSLVRENKSANI